MYYSAINAWQSKSVVFICQYYSYMLTWQDIHWIYLLEIRVLTAFYYCVYENF